MENARSQAPETSCQSRYEPPSVMEIRLAVVSERSGRGCLPLPLISAAEAMTVGPACVKGVKVPALNLIPVARFH